MNSIEDNLKKTNKDNDKNNNNTINTIELDHQDIPNRFLHTDNVVITISNEPCQTIFDSSTPDICL